MLLLYWKIMYILENNVIVYKKIIIFILKKLNKIEKI